MKKRTMAILLALCMALSLLPTVLAAGEGETDPLPEIGFYTSQTVSDESRISGQYNYLGRREEERVVWLVSKNGFSGESEPTVSLAWDFSYPTEEGTATCNESITIPESCVEKVARTGSDPAVYDHRIDLSCVKTALSSVLPRCNPETYLCRLSVQIDDQVAMLEIAIPHRESSGIPVGDGRYILSTYTHTQIDDDTFPIVMNGSWTTTGWPSWDRVGVLEPRNIEGNTEYLVARENEIQWTINRVWLENIVGDGGTWSFDANEKITELQNPTLPFAFYGTAPGCCSLILYEVRVTYEGSSSTHILGLYMDRLDDLQLSEITRGDDDTVDQLNEALRNAPSDCTVNLGNTTYTGVIQVPEGIGVIIFQGAEKTIVEGGIRAEGSKSEITAMGIHFRGTETVTSAATGMKQFFAYSCSFTGYAVAIGAGPHGSSGSVFIRNKVAILINGPAGWPSDNTFIENKTAVKIENLGNFYTPYMFRIYECNFIGNDVDFDVSVPGTFYFNRNYYGTLKQSGPAGWSALQQAYTEASVNNVIERSKAKIEAGADTTVVADVVYKYPVLYWWVGSCSIEEVFGPGEATPAAYSMEFEVNYTNVLTTDWNDTVQLAGDDAGDMIIEAEAFDAETERAKEISVMDESGSAVGTWSFGGGEQ